MTMDQHTPGPWGIEQTRTENWIGPLRRDGKPDPVICSTDREDLKRSALTRNDANARLIAAAPELLAAAKAALAYDAAIWRRGQDGTYDTDPLGAIAEGHDLDALYMDWRNKARDAVAKATGATELETATR
jgi:hypothetical protein